MNNNTSTGSVDEDDKKRVYRRFKSWKFITIGVIVIIAGISYYQAIHFNSQVTINDTKVGGLTADQAVKILERSVLKNNVFIGQQQILDEEDTQIRLTNKDLSEVKKVLKNQWTFFPSSKEKNYSLLPKKADTYRSETMKRLVEEKLTFMNKSLKAPQNTMAKLEQGIGIIAKSFDGKQYDVVSLSKEYEKQKYKSEIHLDPVYMGLIKENNLIVKDEEKMLQDLPQRTIDYNVQNKVYSLKAQYLIKNASMSKDMKAAVDASDIKNKIIEINNSQSTLNKNFTFKTHSGPVISVKGQSYGWAIDIEKETKRIQEAFEKGVTSLSASNIYGNGWDHEAIGYETTVNNGIGDTYAEVSIAEQRIWIYKNGQLAAATNVVTGKHSTNEDTSPGVWYVLYKRSPYTLKGSAVGKPNYSIKVNYWAPFTDSGQGFHDAGWRTNWANNAYLTAGSAGCVNLPPSVGKIVYDNLSAYEPVIVY